MGLGLLVAALPMGELLLRYMDERWFAKSFVTPYWEIRKISFLKNTFDGKVLGYVWFENSCFLQKDIFNSLCILLSETYLLLTKKISIKILKLSCCAFFPSFNFSNNVSWHSGNELSGLDTQDVQGVCEFSREKEKMQCLVF